MTPPVVQLAVTYGAGLWVGLVVLVPWAFVLLAPAVLPFHRPAVPTAWRLVLIGAATAGFVVGRWTAGRPECASVLPRGAVVLAVRTLDPIDGRGRQPAEARACTGRLTLKLRDTIPPGTGAVVRGTHGGRGVITVRHVVPGDRDPAFIPRFRAAVSARIQHLYGARAPLVEALILGRRGDVDPALREAFVAAGLAHLLAISGLHVGLLASWVALLAGAVLGRRRAWIAASAFGWLYVAVLGFPAPATRAATFIALLGLARGLGRHPPFSAILAGGVLTLLLVDPSAVTAVGAWLSAAAVWGTAEAARLVRRRPAPFHLFAVSIGATLATAPISAFAFGQVAPIGILANLVAVPLASIAVPGVFASLIVGGPLAAGAGAVLAATERTAHFFAAIPGGQVVMPAGPSAALLWLAVLVGVAWLVRVRPRIHWLAPRLAAGLALLAWLPFAPRLFRSAPSQLHVFFLPVGQGDAIAIRTPHGRWLLVDAGPRDQRYDAGRDVVVPFLRRQGVRSLDAFLLSHGDMDHVGGAPAVLEAMTVHRVIEPGQPLPQDGYLDFLAAVDVQGVAWARGRTGDSLVVDGVALRVLHPDDGWIATELEANENSLVLHLRYGAFDLLLTGDAGLPMERRLAVSRMEVLKVGHHGSASATGDRLLGLVRPRLAVIPVGRGNRYGHPAPSVLQRLDAAGVPVVRTDRDGMVTLTTDGEYFQVELGGSPTLIQRVLCALSPSRPSNRSSSSRNACIPRRPASLPTSFMTWPSRARSSPATSAGPD